MKALLVIGRVTIFRLGQSLGRDSRLVIFTQSLLRTVAGPTVQPRGERVNNAVGGRDAWPVIRQRLKPMVVWILPATSERVPTIMRIVASEVFLFTLQCSISSLRRRRNTCKNRRVVGRNRQKTIHVSCGLPVEVRLKEERKINKKYLKLQL